MSSDKKRHVTITVKSGGQEFNQVIEVERPNSLRKKTQKLLDEKPLKKKNAKKSVPEKPLKARQNLQKKRKKTKFKEKCPYCNNTLTSEARYQAHILRCQKSEYFRLNPVLENNEEAALSAKPHNVEQTTKKQKSVKASESRFKLYSSRGIEVLGTTYCTVCDQPFERCWRFSRSSKGVAFLCKNCKAAALKKLKRKPAGKGYLHTVPGSFESGKSR